MNHLFNPNPCTVCSQAKPFSEFHVRSSSKNRYSPKCKLCTKEYKRSYYMTVPGLVQDYISIHEASHQTTINRGNIGSACRGKMKSAGGFVWKFTKLLSTQRSINE